MTYKIIKLSAICIINMHNYESSNKLKNRNIFD